MDKSIEKKLGTLSEISQKKLVNIFGWIVGAKDLIIDDELMKPLERIITASKLRSQEVDKIYKLSSESLPLTNTERVFLIRAETEVVKKVCAKINSEKSTSDKHSYSLILVTRKLCTIDRILEEEGLFGIVKVYAFQWELILLDNRVLSLELNNFYRNLYVENDLSFLHSVAKSIWTLFHLLGTPHLSLIQGKYSEIVYNMVQSFNEELASPDDNDQEVTHFILIDRDVDYPSVLLTGVTYTSLLDEEFGIKSGSVEIKSKGKPLSQFLNTSDTIYSQIKSRHFSDVFPYLSQVSKELQATQAKSLTLEISEMKRFVSEQINSITSIKKCLAFHISACEAIIEQMGERFEGLKNTEVNLINCTSRKECINYIEDSLIMNLSNRFAILRLICLLSITNDGLTQDEYLKFKTLFLHIYGYQLLPIFDRLEHANLCSEQAGNKLAKVALRRSAFSSFAQKMSLIPSLGEDYDYKRPKDAGYVFSGNYIPAIAQVVNLLAKDESAEEVAKFLPSCSIKGERKGGKKVKTFLVYFVGGVTYAEIASFQLIEKLTGVNIIVAASSIINGNKLMNSFF